MSNIYCIFRYQFRENNLVVRVCKFERIRQDLNINSGSININVLRFCNELLLSMQTLKTAYVEIFNCEQKITLQLKEVTNQSNTFWKGFQLLWVKAKGVPILTFNYLKNDPKQNDSVLLECFVINLRVSLTIFISLFMKF